MHQACTRHEHPAPLPASPVLDDEVSSGDGLVGENPPRVDTGPAEPELLPAALQNVQVQQSRVHKRLPLPPSNGGTERGEGSREG